MSGREIITHGPIAGRTQQKIGGFAALYLAAAYLVAMPYFILFVKYHDAANAEAKVALLVANHDSTTVMYLITYIVFGIALAILSLSLNERLKSKAPALASTATVVGVMWAFVLVASGMIFNAGTASVVGLYGASPAQAVATWQAIEPVAEGLGGSGGELLGGLWMVLVSVAALRTARLPKALNWLGAAVGVAGILSVVPALRSLAYVFGLLEIVWFVWLGISMLRRPEAE